MQIRQRTNWLHGGSIVEGLRKSKVMKWLNAAAIACCTVMLSACEQDSYDKGDGYFSDTQATFCEAHSNSSNAIDYVVTDEGEQLTLTAPVTSKVITTPDCLYRMTIYYNKVESGKAEVVSMGMVSTLDIVEANEFKNLTTDPVKLESAWVSKSGKYVNLALLLRVGAVDAEVERQSLGMVKIENRNNDDGTTTAVVRLHHSQGDVPEYYSQKYYVSLLTQQIDADSLCLLINTYDGEVEKLMRIR